MDALTVAAQISSEPLVEAVRGLLVPIALLGAVGAAVFFAVTRRRAALWWLAAAVLLLVVLAGVGPLSDALAGPASPGPPGD